MELVVLSIHLLVCICLIGLVLLQRSEGGALGMGGGGGGALMSGRGAADALAKMTSVAGGFFIVTSLGLTLIAGAANTSGRSVMDLLPTQTAPATTAPATTTEEPATAPAETPDPTEGRGPSVNEFALGPANAEASTPRTSAPAPSTASTRAGPIENRPTQTAAVTPRQTTPVNTSGAAQRTTSPTTQRTAPATTQGNTQVAAQRTPPATTSNNSVSGIDLTTDSQLGTESGDSDNGVAAVRRERAGPDQ
ncbi:preprotein translocase subunit SecG [Candidatus Viadribacter manganicus]|uniref:preprotein translocase subunit SecG n=1 Tax=Candidatus Viadribacter manganicus TaxID=1759059 RepID=UPI0008335AF5|nr:preprotein translocase subunit SecG [Candidatus Viadribacter manganicus]